MARGLGKADASRNDRVIDFFAEVLAQLVFNLYGEIRAGIVHRKDDSLDVEAAVEVL